MVVVCVLGFEVDWTTLKWVNGLWVPAGTGTFLVRKMWWQTRVAKSRVTFSSDFNARQHRHSRCQPFQSRQAAAGACVAAELNGR